MSIQFHSTLKRLTVMVITAALGISLLATGVWAGSARNGGDRAQAIQPMSSGWRYDARTGNPNRPTRAIRSRVQLASGLANRAEPDPGRATQT